MRTVSGSIYDYPQYYDLAYGSDSAAELKFLTGCFKQFLDSGPAKLFEPASGTGRLIYRLAKRGYSIVGLDLNSCAVDYCNRRLRKHGFAESASVGDIRSFDLASIGGEPVDAAFNTVNSFRLLTEPGDGESHLECMARCIRPGGIYILGFTLSPIVGQRTTQEAWVSRSGFLQVNTRMFLVGEDRENQIETYCCQYDIYTPSKQFRIEQNTEFRSYTCDQFRDLLDAIEWFTVEGVYDFNYDLSRSIDLDDQAEDAVFVLRRI